MLSCWRQNNGFNFQKWKKNKLIDCGLYAIHLGQAVLKGPLRTNKTYFCRLVMHNSQRGVNLLCGLYTSKGRDVHVWLYMKNIIFCQCNWKRSTPWLQLWLNVCFKAIPSGTIIHLHLDLGAIVVVIVW